MDVAISSFRNITIRSTNTTGSAWTAHFFNGTNNRLNNCVIDMVGNPTGNSNFSNIVVNGSYTSMGTNTTIANNIMVDSCTINNGYYNIYTSASGGGNNTFRFLYNTLTNAYQYGAYFSNSHVIKFNYNKVTLGTLSTSPYGLFLTSNSLSGNFFHEINHNNFNSIGVYGIYLTSSSGSSTVNSQIYNNFMNGFRYSFGTYGIYNSSSSYWNIYHNTINLDAPNTSGTSACIALNFGSNTDVRNNILTVMNPSVVNSFPMWASSTTAASMVDNNIYFNKSNSNLVFIAGNTYNASNFKIAYPNGGGVNSNNTDPSYLSTTNLHISNGCNNGANLGILLDIDGNARGTSPDIGADEVISLPNNDIQVSSISNPTFPLVSGSQPVTVVIKNLGNNTVSTFNVNYILNNGTVVTQAYSGSPIPSCGTATFTFATNVTIVNGANNLKVFTNAPNGSADAIPANDTAQFNLCSAMNGVYTINPAGSGPTNFTSFTAAVNALICGGVNGPVSFNVSNGTYTEQIQIPAIQGTSSTNTIAFTSVSGNPTLCTLTFTPVTGGSYTLYLNGADYVSFNKITIANGYTASTVYTVWIGGKSEYNTISACTIANPSNPNAYGIYQSNTTDNYNTFIGNTITNGYIGIIMQSNTSVYSVKNSFINNILTNQTGYAIYSYFQDSVTISGNIVTTNATTGTYYGIFTQSNGKFPIVTKNKITGINMTSTGYGMQHNSFANNGFSFGRGLIANNFVQMGGTATTNVGIHINGGTNYTDIVHNSVNMTSTVLSPNVSCFRYEQFLSNNKVQNNIFQASGNGTTSCAVANIGTNGTSNCIFNYNNWYGLNSTTFGYSGTAMGTAQNSYAAFKTGGAGIASFEANGFNKEVSFNSTTDLHTSSPCLSNSGTNLLSIVPKDIDDETRTSTPDIGADEFNVSAYDAAMQAIVSPSGTSFATGIPYTVKVKVRNNGSNTITALNMNYSINGTVTSQAFTGLNIASCDTMTLTFTATLTLTTPGSNVFKIFNGLINTTNADMNNVNDTIVLNLCTPYSGTYVINKNLPFSTTNFASINQAVNAMYSCGVSGPVILRIAAGSGPYNEQVNFSGVIPGSNRLATVTLSGNTTREIVSFGTGGTATQHVIRLSGAKHIKLDSLTINNPGTGYGIGVHITGGADSNFVQNSIINISLASTSFSNSAGVAISSTAASATGTGNNGNSNRIFNNTINGGYYGITALGTNTTIFCLRNDISNNVLNGQAYYGIFTQYQDLIKINGNTIDNMLSSNTNSAGLYCAYVERFELKKNKINRSGQYGMNLNYMNYQLGTGTARSEISNNMIGGTFYSTNPYGLYLANQGRHIDIWHNSIHVINMGSGYGFYFQYQTSGTYEGLDFANNTITATNNTNYVSWMYWSTGLTPSNPIINFMSNNIWSPNTTSSLAVFNQNGYTGAGWISANTNGLNTLTCKNLDPQYLNEATNLHIIQGNLNDVGTNLSQVNTDIDGDIRPLAPSSTVDIGADEFAVPALNIGPVALVSPTAPLTSGLQDVVVKIKNFGSATVTSANVSYKVGFNGSIKTVAWSGSIATNATADVTFTGGNQYNFTGSYDTVIAWTDGPNGGVDQYKLNDTFISNTICQPLAGSYTINALAPVSATNFQSFTQLAGALNNCGMTAAVNVTVVAGTYLDNVIFGNVLGNDTTKPITIDGEMLPLHS
ncbi:MAG: right-handed parallel beta-helix repeat-containing protein [Bacteroidetes bacterium]|nr:right-handed parallel beta-helix repeat-containing protein [Bacteroidota bacterium]